ncbi:stage III sporulation protein AE [Compostibacillus humi]|uniref:Stage III sporulation protein AE n=1 Tax=Compostibacillus humi TaxID=1245525 RepID=A0A8J2XED7_9BACI|nr:stage III sporulation protein AE [Compostibacillus humi]GFZ77409.1 stage III sporulation protein AE [Compostibacillus humi]HLT56629.1 stage III sporulation protein AE [Bacillota bacterium]
MFNSYLFNLAKRKGVNDESEGGIKKKIILFLFVFLLTGQASVFAQDEGEDVQDYILSEISLEGVEQYWNELQQEYGDYLPELDKITVYEFIKNEGSLSLKNIFLGFIHYLFHELILNGKLLGSLLMLTLFSMLLQTIHTAFESSSVSKIAYFVIYAVLILIALNSFYVSVSYTEDAIRMMTSFMIGLIPLILGLMATFGNIVSISFFHPMIIFLINVSGVLISKIILPLLFLSALLMIVSSLSEKYKVTQLATLFKNVSMGILGVFLTIFLGVISVQGSASAIQDGVAMKTAKFITGNFIPVVGRTFTDATDTILSASLLLKNTIGIVGLCIVLFIALFPAIKILAVALIYKITAALLQPVGDGPVISALNTISNYILLILASLLTITLMFFLAIVIIIVASNLTLLVR